MKPHTRVAPLLSVSLLMALLAACGDEDGSARGTEPGGSWADLPAAPVSGRSGSLAGWTGTEALFLGGSIGVPCAPSASCAAPDELARDGAAYDPVQGTWRTTAVAPIPLGNYFRTAMSGDTMILFGDDRWLAYDAGDDAWRDLPAPPQPAVDTGYLSVADGRAVALTRGGDIELLDLATSTWSELPGSTLEPRLSDRYAVAVPGRILVGGVDRATPDDQPAVQLVDSWDGRRWTRLTTGQLYPLVHWTGTRVVTVDIQSVDGGEVDGWGRAVPTGGRLDPATGDWTRLKGAPGVDDLPEDGWYPLAADGPLVAAWGYAYDDNAGTWTALGRPDAGAEVDSQQSSVWVGEDLLVFGGLDEDAGYDSTDGLSHDAWVWRP